MTDKRRQ